MFDVSYPTPVPSLRLVAIARMAELLAELQRETPGLLSATLASADGLTVASTLSSSHEADRLSAMFGSLSALAGALTRETGLQQPDTLVLESAAGRIVSTTVTLREGYLVLALVADQGPLLGKLLWSCRHMAARLAACTGEQPV